jgi:ABC-type lipoprotein release transport system permease subunit
VYLIILCAVLIATAIPAWRICRSEITVALKDE